MQPRGEGFWHDLEHLLGRDMWATGKFLGLVEIEQDPLLALPVLEVSLGFVAVIPSGDVDGVGFADVLDRSAVPFAEDELVVSDLFRQPRPAE